MKWTLPVPFVALAALAVVMVPAAAQAQSQRQTAAPRPSQHTVFTSRDETGRTHTRIIVTPRSYLDGGTEVLPGQRKYSDYAIPPYHSAIGDALGPGRDYDRQPLNSRWESSSGWNW